MTPPHRATLGRPGPLRVTVVRIGAVSLAAAALMFGGLWWQMQGGSDPILAAKAEAASAKHRQAASRQVLVQAPAQPSAPVVSAPAPVVTQTS